MQVWKLIFDYAIKSSNILITNTFHKTPGCSEVLLYCCYRALVQWVGNTYSSTRCIEGLIQLPETRPDIALAASHQRSCQARKNRQRVRKKNVLTSANKNITKKNNERTSLVVLEIRSSAMPWDVTWCVLFLTVHFLKGMWMDLFSFREWNSTHCTNEQKILKRH